MNRPPLEVADLVRAAGRAFIERSRKWITWQHLKVLRAIARCRTAALGGHLDECTDCGYRPAISYNSCRDRHCPKCQANARHRWLEARRQDLLPTRYVHVVFTLPHELAPLALQNKKILYHLLLTKDGLPPFRQLLTNSGASLNSGSLESICQPSLFLSQPNCPKTKNPSSMLIRLRPLSASHVARCFRR